MGYVSDQDVETRVGSERLVQLTDDSGTGAADPTVVAEARAAAEGELDSYLGRRYSVPINLAAHGELAGLIVGVVLDLVEHRLHARRSPVPDAVAAKRAAAVKWLGAVASGAVVLPSVVALSPNPSMGYRAASVGAERVLSRDELADY